MPNGMRKAENPYPMLILGKSCFERNGKGRMQETAWGGQDLSLLPTPINWYKSKEREEDEWILLQTESLFRESKSNRKKNKK